LLLRGLWRGRGCSRGVEAVGLRRRWAVTTANLLLSKGNLGLRKRSIVRLQITSVLLLDLSLSLSLGLQLLLTLLFSQSILRHVVRSHLLHLLALLVLLLLVLLGRALVRSGGAARSIGIGLDRRRVVTWALGRSWGRRSRRCHRIAAAIPKLFVALVLSRRSWCQTGVLVGVFSSFGEISVEVQDLEDSLRVALIILLGNCWRVKELRPLWRQTDKFSSLWIETNMYSVGKVSRIADTAHTWTSAIDEVNPLVQVIVTLYLDLEGLGLTVVVARAVRRTIWFALDFEDGTGGFDSSDVNYISEVKGIRDFAAFGFVEIERLFAED
jgi:hypothetical protein